MGIAGPIRYIKKLLQISEYYLYCGNRLLGIFAKLENSCRCFSLISFYKGTLMQIWNLLIWFSLLKDILSKIFIFNPLELLNLSPVSLSFSQSTSYFLTCSVVISKKLFRISAVNLS